MILAAIERRTGQPTCRMFDLIAGTSTGGILALGLVKPNQSRNPAYSAQELVNLYRRQGRRIFSTSVWRRIRALGNLLDEKYPATGIERVLAEYFGATSLSKALTEVLITGYEIERRVPWFFKSRYARTKEDYDFPMTCVARSTSAAPTYFEPARIMTSDQSDYYALIDGGVFAYNPAMCAWAEARVAWPRARDFLLVSLGTGELTKTIPYGAAKDWGLAQWAQRLLGVIFHGVGETVDYQLRQLLPPKKNGDRRYYRFQVRLDEKTDDIDNASPANLRALQLLADDCIKENDKAIGELCRRMRQ
jgi:predicted acylesterase/phospholipase RssA